jgi:anaerobic selenocysteine-containing dehydrogenase
LVTPTGEMTVGETDIITSCTCDCPDTCSIVARVANGKVLSIRGNPDFEITRGFLCRKSHNFLKRLFSTRRVLFPLRRRGSKWERLSWDEASGLIASRIEAAIREFGPLSVFYYRDAGSIAALKHVNERFFNLLGGGTFASGSLCGGAGIAGQTADFGIRTSHDPSDLLNSRMIIIWGRNPAWTNVHLVPILREARRRGTSIVLIDPVATPTARLCDIQLRPIPGTDGYLALGIAGVLVEEGLVDRDFLSRHTEGYETFLRLAERFPLDAIHDITGVSANDIEELACQYGRSHPAAILGGWGVQRRRNGANIYRLMDALAALTGNVGLPGGGVSHGMDEMRWFDKGVLLPGRAKERRYIPRPAVGRGLKEICDPPVKVAIISGANPVAQCPSTELVREALGRIEFVVVLDMLMTDTALAADILLPSTHFLQERDIVGSYWHNYVMPVNPAQGRLGEEKTDLETFSLLAGALGLGEDFPDEPDYYLSLLASRLSAGGLGLRDIMAGPIRPPGAVSVPFQGGTFPGPSGKFHFVTEVSAPREDDTGTYPYILVSPHPHGRTHSQLTGSEELALPEVHISRALGEKHHLLSGDAVVVESPHGALTCKVVLTDRIRPGVILIYEGWWDHLGGSVNRLTTDELSDMGQSATYYDTRCRLSDIKGDRSA